MRTTNWCVITGAPCSGKTSVIRELERRGFSVVHEAARAYIDQELCKGKSIGAIKSDILSFEQRILYKKFEIETALADSRLIFMDRAVPDSIGYYMFENLNPDEPIAMSRQFWYKKVFFFERLDFEKDRARSEDDRIAAQLDNLLKKGYRSLGYSLVHVPLMTITERTDFILERI